MDVIPILVVLLLPLSVAALSLLLARAMGGQSRRATAQRAVRQLQAFAREVEGELRVEPDLHGSLLKGTLEGRRVTVQLGEPRAEGFLIQFGVEIDPDVRLRLRAPTLMGRVQRALGAGRVVATGAEADRLFLIEGDDGAQTREVFVHGGGELCGLLADLIHSGHTDAVVAEGGWLYLECELEALDPRWLRWFFNRMLKVARFYERRPIRIKATGPQRYGWTGGGAETRCPFCREGLDTADEASGEGLVACEGCNTLHHDACFAENDGCTIYGCGGRRAERVDA